jgi:hypothetical protein
MKQLVTLLIISFLPLLMIAQTTISGHVTDQKGAPIIGASIMIKGTYDGAISELDGQFSFTTQETGMVALQISYLGYETKSIQQEVEHLDELVLKLRESVVALDAVEITASTFKAGDNSKIAVLQPLDIVTTAGSMGDVVAAMQTLPGTQSNAEDGRLFVRGGEARETNIYIDGLRVFTPYTRTIGGTPSRGRFSPFLFKGVSFSTGGYSAEFGQGLSGVLDMNTIDDPNDTETNISLMTVGAGLGHTQKWDKQSLSLSGSYVNLTPYMALVPSRVNWIDPYAGFSGEAVYRLKLGDGLLKSYIAGDANSFMLSSENIDTKTEEFVNISNSNIYSNTSYRSPLGDHHSIFAGFSMGNNSDELKLDSTFRQEQNLNGIHARLSLKSYFGERLIAHYGVDVLHQKDGRKIYGELESRQSISRNWWSTFFEMDYYFSKNLAFKAGGRLEHHTLTGTTSFDPRITIAQNLSKNSQISAAYGQYTQEINSDFLFYDTDLFQEQSSHYLINYNYKTEKQILRVESYYKSYQNLLKYDNAIEGVIALDNSGDGYAYGIDLFWRANQLFKNVDCWISYSWLENKRRYLDFPVSATPQHATRHNLSVVSKIWMPKLKSQLGVTYNMTSGRPYEDPNTEGFMNERSKYFNNISLSWAYLISQQKILFVSVSNPTSFRNEFGYEFGRLPNEDGIYPGRLIRPNEDQFFFAGFFVTISTDKSKNQLNNL